MYKAGPEQGQGVQLCIRKSLRRIFSFKCELDHVHVCVFVNVHVNVPTFISIHFIFFAFMSQSIVFGKAFATP